jgi:hypothetical protein
VFCGLLVLSIVVVVRERRRLVRPLAAVGLGAAHVIGPVSLYSLGTRGSLSYTAQSYLYAILDDESAGQPRYGEPYPSPLQFVRDNQAGVAARIIRNAQGYARELFARPAWLLFLLPAWPPVLLALARHRYSRAALPVLMVAAGSFAFACLTWSTFQLRYLLPVLLLLLPIAVDGLTRLGLGRLRLPGLPSVTALVAVILAIALLWSRELVADYRDLDHGGSQAPHDFGPSRVDLGVRWTGPAAWLDDADPGRTADWILASTRPDDTLALHGPWLPAFFTQRPTTRLPADFKNGKLTRFLTDYRIAYVLLNSDSYRGRYQDELRSLQSAGVRQLRGPGFPIFDTRALWSPSQAPPKSVTGLRL